MNQVHMGDRGDHDPGVALESVRLSAVGASTPDPRRDPEAQFEGAAPRPFVRSGVSTADLARRAGAACLARGGVRPAEVDAVVLVTESFWDGAGGFPHLAFRDELLQAVVQDLGLECAAVYGNWTAACGNLAPALNLARSLLIAHAADRVLLVAADRLRPGLRRQAMTGGAVLSDVAAACILDRERGGLQLEDIVLRPSPRILAPRAAGNFVLQARELRQAIRGLADQVEVRSGAPLADFDLVVAETLEEPLIELLCAQTGLARRRVLTPGRASYGHAFSADLLLSIGAIADTLGSGPPRRVAAISLSSWTLSASLFELEPLNAPAPQPQAAPETSHVH
jgi:hypothetical protein